jgi:hypothetical protein
VAETADAGQNFPAALPSIVHTHTSDEAAMKGTQNRSRAIAVCLRRLSVRAGARLFFSGIAVASIAALAGCATPASFAPGATEAQLQARLGAPDRVHPLPDGGRRLEYARYAFDQLVYMVDLDALGRVTAVRQVRTMENFARLRPGVDDQESVLREFGRPWGVERYALSGLTAWLYPHKEAGVFDSMMAVMFDARGRFVRAENGPDPRFILGSDLGDHL